MIEKIINTIIRKQLEENIILQEEVNIYKYGYTLVYEVMINLVIALVIGIISHKFMEVISFLCLYIPLRSFCGGWHANKIWKCTIFSNLILLIMVEVYEYCISTFTIIETIIIFTICILLVFLLSPIDTKSKPISIEEKKRYKTKINLILIIHMFLMIIMIVSGLENIIFVLVFSYITQVTMILLEIINRNIGRNILKHG